MAQNGTFPGLGLTPLIAIKVNFVLILVNGFSLVVH